MTNYEKILFLIKRLAGCYTREERYLLETATGQPMKYYLKEGAGGAEDGTGRRFYGLTELRHLVKMWRKEGVAEFSEDEYQKLLGEVELGLKELREQCSQQVCLVSGKLSLTILGQE